MIIVYLALKYSIRRTMDNSQAMHTATLAIIVLLVVIVWEYIYLNQNYTR